MIKTVRSLATLLFAAFLFGKSVTAQPVLNFQLVANGLSSPVDIVTAPGDSRLYIAQQNGLIRVWTGSGFTDFINLSGVITNPAGSEQGLLSLAFHPNYATNGYFFVWYTGASGAVTLARYQRNAGNPNIADPGSAQLLLSIPKPGAPYFTNHNGGKLIFGADGMLYFGTGDGGSGGDPFNNAQNGNSLLGKMLRIDVSSFATSAPFYHIPPDNPFAASGDGVLDEIYSIGLRNPWRWSFDRANGDMWIADVGQNLWEEINWMPAGSSAGANYGWRCYEGAHIYSGGGCSPSGTVSPVFEYPHNGTTGGFSVTGGYVYRGPDVQNIPLLGYYITADYVSGNVWMIRPNGTGGWNSYRQAGLPGTISSFGEAADGTLYALSRGSGSIYKVMLASVVPTHITSFNGVAYREYNQLEWTTSSEINTSTFIIEHSADGRHFSPVGQVPANGSSAGSRYSFRHDILQKDFNYYRIVAQDQDASIRVSEIIRLHGIGGVVRIFPTMLRGNSTLTIISDKPLQNVQLTNSAGRRVWQRNITGVSGALPLLLPGLPAGVYIIQVNGTDHVHTEKIIID